MARFAERLFVWCGGALFVASLAYAAWTYIWTFSRVVPWSGHGVLLDFGLLAGFALHHSLFARPWLKTAMARVFPERLLRALYVWIASVLLILVLLLWHPVGGDVHHASSAWARTLHAAIQIAGVAFIAWSVQMIDGLELAGIRTGPPSQGVQTSQGAPPANAGALQIRGPYRVVRHPLYLGWMLAVFGPAHMTGDRLAFAALTSLYLVVAIPWEERSLEATFGAAYAAYKQTVRWKVVPGIY